ncbi:teashirt homolog 3 [Lates japonicus]|uniref:Teashirt homolog 3 n=1 Tax=Lates japonicus TaxID=270547 RepID=A0AAD3RLX8_LATJO|nr:teashirt homolog 3 [Lates japonicus]
MPLRKQQGSESWDLIVRPTYGLTVLASFNNNNTPPLALFAGVSVANVLALQAPLLMKVLWLDSGEVESRL